MVAMGSCEHQFVEKNNTSLVLSVMMTFFRGYICVNHSERVLNYKPWIYFNSCGHSNLASRLINSAIALDIIIRKTILVEAGI